MKDIEFSKKEVDGQTFYVMRSVDKDVEIKPWLLGVIGLIIGFINGFWGGGGGMIAVPTLSNIVKLPEKKAHATAILIMLPLCVVSCIVYAIGGVFDWLTTVKVTIGFVAGGALGALLLKNLSNVVLQIVFAVVIIASGIKLLI